MRLVITNGERVNKLFKPASCFDVCPEAKDCSMYGRNRAPKNSQYQYQFDAS
ncbi:hypothetical protein GHT06_012458 [Daphnia sinensis]|uniref:Uncharacterized protein n=1 Tax=Daphnia sinensis TaxID=1820382 RepID=A0AAD5LGC1_9CRUS|nr:hypothetical protein GHT06_012458 [Daphnia sinensis]